jgi:hypothetical protein
MADQQAHLQGLSEEYQKLEGGKFIILPNMAHLIDGSELQSNIQLRQKLESQQQENKAVQKVRNLSAIYSTNS